MARSSLGGLRGDEGAAIPATVAVDDDGTGEMAVVAVRPPGSEVDNDPVAGRQRLGRIGVGGANLNRFRGDATAGEGSSDLAFDLFGRKRVAIELEDTVSRSAPSE